MQMNNHPIIYFSNQAGEIRGLNETVGHNTLYKKGFVPPYGEQILFHSCLR